MILPQTDGHRRNWLKRIAHNLTVDHNRHNKLIVFQPLPGNEDAQLPELMVAGHEDWICDRDRLREVLAQMPQRHQQCVGLLDQGYKQIQIAAILGIRPSRVSEILRDVETQLKRKFYIVPASFQREIMSICKDLGKSLSGVSADAELLKDLLPSSSDGPFTDECTQLIDKTSIEVLSSLNELYKLEVKLGYTTYKGDFMEAILPVFDPSGRLLSVWQRKPPP